MASACAVADSTATTALSTSTAALAAAELSHRPVGAVGTRPKYSLTGIRRVSTVADVQAIVFSALGEPSRLQIVELLGPRPRSVGEIAEVLGIRQPQVSKHLKVLGESGMVRVEPRARQRIYHLQAAPFDEIARWAGSFEHLWQTRLDSLGDFLRTNEAEEGPP